jgi:hypothetical protein
MSEQTRTKQVESAKELDVYKAAYKLAMEIFELTKGVPARRKVRANESDTTIFEISVSEFARSMGETSLRSTFRQQTNRL